MAVGSSELPLSGIIADRSLTEAWTAPCTLGQPCRAAEHMGSVDFLTFTFPPQLNSQAGNEPTSTAFSAAVSQR